VATGMSPRVHRAAKPAAEDRAWATLAKRLVAIQKNRRNIGSGIVLDPPTIVATCAHVLRNHRDVRIRTRSQTLNANVTPAVDTSADAAIIRTAAQAIPDTCPPLDTGSAGPAQNVVILVRTRRPVRGTIVTEPGDNGCDSSEFTVRADSEMGMSGSPVFTTGGQLVGLVKSRPRQGLVRCVPVSELVRLAPPYTFGRLDGLLSRYVSRLPSVLRSYYDDWESYIPPRCALGNRKGVDLVRLVLEEWLPDDASRLLVILGEPGSGKTMFCDRLASQLASSWQTGRAVPFLVKLRDLRQCKSTEDFLAKRVADWFDIPRIDVRDLSFVLRSSHALLLCDGFDEMSLKAGTLRMQDDFRQMASAIPPDVKTVITCRSNYFSTPVELAEAIDIRQSDRVVNIRQFDRAESFFTRQYRTREVTIAELMLFTDKDVRAYLKSRVPGWRRLYQRISRPEFYNLPDLAHRPILLVMIASMRLRQAKSGTKLTVTGLYDQYTCTWFDYEAARLGHSRGGPDHGRVVRDLSAIVEELAYLAYADRRTRITRELLDAVLSGSGHTAYQVGLDEFTRKYPFLRWVGQDGTRTEFIHQSFFEYFVARRILRDIQAHDHKLYAKEYLTSAIDKYLFELLDAAGLVGEDTPTYRGVLVPWLKRHPVVNVRMNCAQTLGRSGNSDYIPVLRQCLEVERDIGVGGRLAEALVALGDRKSLLQFLGNLDRYSGLVTDPGKRTDHRLLYDIVGTLPEIPPEIVGKLVKNLKDPTPRIQKFAAFEMGRIPGEAGVTGLARLLLRTNENTPEGVRTRRYAAAALGLKGVRAGLPALRETLRKSRNPHVQEECAKAIDAIQRGSQVPAVVSS